MSTDILQYAYLWQQVGEDWALMKAPELQGGYCIVNKRGSILIIEDEEVNEIVCNRMKEAGYEIVDDLPTVAVPTPNPSK